MLPLFKAAKLLQACKLTVCSCGTQITVNQFIIFLCTKSSKKNPSSEWIPMCVSICAVCCTPEIG